MNRSRSALAAATVLTALAGCIPEKRIVWSPDGKTAAVCAVSGLYFINSDGHVLPPRLKDTTARCAWFKDGKRLVVAHVVKGGGWSDIAGLFDPAETNTIKERAVKLRERILSYNGDWDKFELDPEDRLSPGQEVAIFMYVRDKMSEGLPEKLGGKWKEFKESPVGIWQLQLFDLDGEQLKPGKILLRTLDEIRQPGIAPTQTIVSLMKASEDARGDAPCLYVVAASGGPTRLVASNVALDYDWSPGGKSLAFIASNTPAGDGGAVQLGSLTTITVADEKGQLLAEWAERNDRAGLLFNPVMGVKWLSDGRLLFSSAEVTLPATTRDMPQRWSLFFFDPKMPASVIRALGRDFPESLDPSTALFEVSPDESSVLLPGTKGRLCLYKLADGTTTVIQGTDDADGKTRSLPCWKGKDEICFVNAAHKTDDGKPVAEVVVWTAGKTRVISNGWPDAMKEGWLQGGQ